MSGMVVVMGPREGGGRFTASLSLFILYVSFPCEPSVNDRLAFS